MEHCVCHDCGRDLEKNEEYMPYKVEGEVYLKCRACHAVDPVLRNFKQTEVYSRIVGYIRPVKQWNKGKQEEFKDRREYVVEQPSCC